MSLAGNRPLRGTWLLALVLGLIMAAFEAPMRLYEALPVEVSFSYAIFGIAFLLVAASVAWSLTFRSEFDDMK